MMRFPTEIRPERLGQHGCRVRKIHHHVMLKPIGAHVAHQLLQFRNAGHGAGAEGVELIVGQRTLADIRADAAFIALHYAEPLTVEAMARHVGIHPNYAMTMFKRTFGTTLIHYLTQHRISHAQRLLATTDQKILGIALNSGFGSISRFNAAFLEGSGCSPREYRKQNYALQ